MRITFDVDMRGINGTRFDVHLANRKLLWLLESLVKCNLLYLREHPETPPLYESGVVYKPEFSLANPARGTEEWKDISAIRRDGNGDCEDLSGWRVAELRNEGFPAKGFLKWNRHPSGTMLYHVMVLCGKTLEDPSRKLGMRGDY